MFNTLVKQEMMIWGPVVKTKLKKVFTDEKGDVSIVTMVVLMGIAVLLALTFKTQVEELLGSLFGTITGKAKNAVSGGVGDGGAGTGGGN